MEIITENGKDYLLTYIAKIDNSIEREIYIEKIAKGYNISKEAIFGQVNKLQYSNKKSVSNLEKTKPVLPKKENKEIQEDIIKRENLLISILINTPENFQLIEPNIKEEDFKYEINKKIAKILYEELKKENSNVSSILDKIEDDEIQSHLTMIMAEDYGIVDEKKAIEDILKKYEKEKLENRRDELIKLTAIEENPDIKKQLGKELNDIILKLVKIK